MDKFTVLEGVAAPLKMINVDTDMIIPKQYLKSIKRTGFGGGLFAEKRYRENDLLQWQHRRMEPTAEVPGSGILDREQRRVFGVSKIGPAAD